MPTVGTPTVGAHSFDALSLLLVLNPGASALLIRAVAWHDMAEAVVGDVPSPTLAAFADYGRAYNMAERAYLEQHFGLFLDHLTVDEHAWLAGVDKLECFLYARDQIQLGNTHMYRPYGYLLKWRDKLCDVLPKDLVEFWREVENRGVFAPLGWES